MVKNVNCGQKGVTLSEHGTENAAALHPEPRLRKLSAALGAQSSGLAALGAQSSGLAARPEQSPVRPAPPLCSSLAPAQPLTAWAPWAARPGTWGHDSAICHARLPAPVPACTLTLRVGVRFESACARGAKPCWLPGSCPAVWTGVLELLTI